MLELVELLLSFKVRSTSFKCGIEYWKNLGLYTNQLQYPNSVCNSANLRNNCFCTCLTSKESFPVDNIRELRLIFSGKRVSQYQHSEVLIDSVYAVSIDEGSIIGLLSKDIRWFIEKNHTYD